MGDPSKSIAPLLGRILLCWIFLFSAIGQILEFTVNEQRAVNAGLPFPALAIAVSIVIQTLGGLSLLLGFQARLGGWLLFLFLIPTTLAFHRFWALQGPAHTQQELNFLRNIAIMGGLLFVGTFGAGAYSLDSARAGKHTSPEPTRDADRSAT